MLNENERAPDVLIGETTLRTVVVAVSVLILVIAMAGLCVFFFGVLYSGFREGVWLPIFQAHFLGVIGIPVSVFVAVGVVQFFRGLHGPIEFQCAGVRFSGATGPVILWIFCFLAIAGAMRWLWM